MKLKRGWWPNGGSHSGPEGGEGSKLNRDCFMTGQVLLLRHVLPSAQGS